MSRTIDRAFERSIVLKTTTTTTTRRGRARAQRVRLRCHEIDVARSPRASAACAATVARAPSSVRREVCAPRELFQTSALRRSLLPARQLNDFWGAPKLFASRFKDDDAAAAPRIANARHGTLGTPHRVDPKARRSLRSNDAVARGPTMPRPPSRSAPPRARRSVYTGPHTTPSPW